MTEVLEPISDEKSRLFQFIKLKIIAIGLVLTFSVIMLFPFFFQLRYPQEKNLPYDIRPDWARDENVLKTMAFWGDLGFLLGWITIIFGLSLVIYGLINRHLHKQIKKSKKFESTSIDSFIKALKSDRNFVFFFISTVIFAMLWFFNILTYPGNPGGPLYFLRKTYLRYSFPDEMEYPDESLPSVSTYGAFGAIQDTVILLILLYFVYVRLRPGRQFGEDFVDFALQRTLFLVILVTVSLFHSIGHLPFELYGKGQWGTGYTSPEDWIAFDKIAHMLTSIAITMLFFAIVTKQFTKMGADSEGSNIFAILVAIAFMISVGLAWEVYEWVMNAILAFFDAPSHFVDEILDAPKDLLWDAIGGFIGAILGYVDQRRHLKPSTENDIEL